MLRNYVPTCKVFKTWGEGFLMQQLESLTVLISSRRLGFFAFLALVFLGLTRTVLSWHQNLSLSLFAAVLPIGLHFYVWLPYFIYFVLIFPFISLKNVHYYTIKVVILDQCQHVFLTKISTFIFNIETSANHFILFQMVKGSWYCSQYNTQITH